MVQWVEIYIFITKGNGVQALARPLMAPRDAAGEALRFLSGGFYHLRQFVLLNIVSTLQLWSVSKTPPKCHTLSRGADREGGGGHFASPGFGHRCCS